MIAVYRIFWFIMMIKGKISFVSSLQGISWKTVRKPYMCLWMTKENDLEAMLKVLFSQTIIVIYCCIIFCLMCYCALLTQCVFCCYSYFACFSFFSLLFHLIYFSRQVCVQEPVTPWLYQDQQTDGCPLRGWRWLPYRCVPLKPQRLTWWTGRCVLWRWPSPGHHATPWAMCVAMAMSMDAQWDEGAASVLSLDQNVPECIPLVHRGPIIIVVVSLMIVLFFRFCDRFMQLYSDWLCISHNNAAILHQGLWDQGPIFVFGPHELFTFWLV